MQVNLAF